MMELHCDIHKWKENLKKDNHRICANCIHVRQLTEEEELKYKNWPYEPAPNMYCEHPKDRQGHHPHAVWQGNHCFCHEWDDESVLIPGGHMWEYERQRATDLMIEKSQISMDEVMEE